MKQQFIKIFLLLILIIMTFLPISSADNENSDSINIGSEAAILMDNTTGKILYGKNENERKYPASTTKILTAIIAIENCNLDDTVTVSYNAISIVPSGYSVAALQVGEELTVEQLLQVLLIHSANDAANVLAEHIGGTIESFATIMNTKVQEIGCKNTHFTNPSGKHDNDHYTTPYDLALIMQYCMKNPTFRSIAGSKSCIIPKTNKYEQRVFTNTNELLTVDTRNVPSNYYYQYAIAGKTGYTSQAKNCLVSCANKDNFELTCVVLGAGQDYNGLSYRFIDTKKLFEYGYNNYTIKKIREQGAIAKQIEVPNATKDTKDLNLLISNDITVVVSQSENIDNILPDIKLNDNLSAPITESEVVGSISYNIDNIEYKCDLKASHNVNKSNSVIIIIQIILLIFVIFILYKMLTSKNYKKKRKKSKYIYKK